MIASSPCIHLHHINSVNYVNNFSSLHLPFLFSPQLPTTRSRRFAYGRGLGNNKHNIISREINRNMFNAWGDSRRKNNFARYLCRLFLFKKRLLLFFRHPETSRGAKRSFQFLLMKFLFRIGLNLKLNISFEWNYQLDTEQQHVARHIPSHSFRCYFRLLLASNPFSFVTEIFHFLAELFHQCLCRFFIFLEMFFREQESISVIFLAKQGVFEGWISKRVAKNHTKRAFGGRRESWLSGR